MCCSIIRWRNLERAGPAHRARSAAALFTDAATALRDHGYAFDYVSDRFLAQASVEKGRVMLGGLPYQILMVPECRYMPVDTLRNLIELARNGATVVMLGDLPQDVPGFGNLEARRVDFKKLWTRSNWRIVRARGRVSMPASKPFASQRILPRFLTGTPAFPSRV